MTFRLNPGAFDHIARLSEDVKDNALADIADDARRFAPVDTGELAGSIHVAGDQVVAEADHAGYVELGTRHMAAQPYLAPALYRKRHLRAGGA